MNGLRSSNIIELRVEDVDDAEELVNYPGYFIFTKSRYKTSTIYGEKVIVLPKNLFSHLKLYQVKLRPILSQSSNDYLFVPNDGEKMTHGAIGSTLTASFDKAGVFNKQEYPRVSPTRIRCACATFGCMEEGIDSGSFAKHFMQNKEKATNIHYNLYANHREALKLAMMIGDTFEIGGIEQRVAKQDIEKLTTAIIDSEKNDPLKEQILKFFEKVDMDNNEMVQIQEILSELDPTNNSSKFYKSNASSTKGITLEVSSYH